MATRAGFGWRQHLCPFVENARLEVHGDVIISEAIIQSAVMANRVYGWKGARE